jgi:hypothetical protein
MDPITAAIVAVLPALASDLVKSSVKDAYEALKAVIRRKWGNTVATAVDGLEADPSSKERAAVLADQVAAVNAAEDPDTMKALATLVAELKEAKIGGGAIAAINVTVSGGAIQGVVGAKEVSVDTMIFGTPPKN